MHRAKEYRQRPKYEQGRGAEAGKVSSVLGMHTLEMLLAQEDIAVEIESRQPDLAVPISLSDSTIWCMTRALDEKTELFPRDAFRIEAQVAPLCDKEVGLVAN